MITAVRAWAVTQDGWDHPLKSIKDALIKKSSGRVFQTDEDFTEQELEKKFNSRAKAHPLYFDYTIRR